MQRHRGRKWDWKAQGLRYRQQGHWQAAVMGKTDVTGGKMISFTDKLGGIRTSSTPFPVPFTLLPPVPGWGVRMGLFEDVPLFGLTHPWFRYLLVAFIPVSARNSLCKFVLVDLFFLSQKNWHPLPPPDFHTQFSTHLHALLIIKKNKPALGTMV